MIRERATRWIIPRDSLARLSSKVADQLGYDRDPGRIADDLLAAAGTGWEQLELVAVARNHPAEEEAASRARDEHIAIERAAEIRWIGLRAPQFVARAIIAD